MILKPEAPAARTIKSIAFYLPQYYPIPENDKNWGLGFTEWNNVVKARPLFPGHNQPNLPQELGFYDLRLPETRLAQTELARKYRIDAFCYYHYWFNGRRLLGRPLDEILDRGEPNFPFCLCWANESWRRNWDGASGEVLVEQRYGVRDDVKHGQWLAQVFSDSRYIRLDGRPIMLVYRVNDLPNPNRTARIWREESRAAGVGEICLVTVDSPFGPLRDPRDHGFDAAVEFAPDWRVLPDPEMSSPRARVYDYREVVQHLLAKNAPSWPWIRGVAPGWDNTPRRRSKAKVLRMATPERYRNWVIEAVKKGSVEWPSQSPMIFINAWNEWGEGAILEPSQRWGRAFLEAHHDAIKSVTIES